MYEIDFFELMFLSEAVIPPTPIARHVCFEKFSEVFYHKMTKAQRKQFWFYVIKQPKFDIENEECLHFDKRFDPDNQYSLILKDKSCVEAYLYQGNYHVKKNKYLSELQIKEITKI